MSRFAKLVNAQATREQEADQDAGPEGGEGGGERTLLHSVDHIEARILKLLAGRVHLLAGLAAQVTKSLLKGLFGGADDLGNCVPRVAHRFGGVAGRAPGVSGGCSEADGSASSRSSRPQRTRARS